MPELSMVQALNAALRHCLAADDRTLVFGQDVGRLGGVFRVTDGLQREFGERRVFDTPLAESGIVGVAVGLAMAGWRPVPVNSACRPISAFTPAVAARSAAIATNPWARSFRTATP